MVLARRREPDGGRVIDRLAEAVDRFTVGLISTCCKWAETVQRLGYGRTAVWDSQERFSRKHRSAHRASPGSVIHPCFAESLSSAAAPKGMLRILPDPKARDRTAPPTADVEE